MKGKEEKCVLNISQLKYIFKSLILSTNLIPSLKKVHTKEHYKTLLLTRKLCCEFMIKHKLECMKERSVSDIWFLLYEKWNRSVAEEIIHESLS